MDTVDRCLDTLASYHTRFPSVCQPYFASADKKDAPPPPEPDRILPEAHSPGIVFRSGAGFPCRREMFSAKTDFLPESRLTNGKDVV